MADYISREAAKLRVVEALGQGKSPYNAIVMLPAADVRENKRGKWDDKKVAFYFKCSECGCCVRAFAGEVFLDYAQEWNFCPNCGAEMREES